MTDLVQPMPRAVWRSCADLNVQVAIAIVAGVLVGWYFPSIAVTLKPLGDVIVRALKMVIGPIIFLTVVVGIAGMGDLRKAGRVGLKALIYFEIVTTIALAMGLLAANLLRPGDGFPMAINAGAEKAVSTFASEASKLTFLDYLVRIVPDNVFGAFVSLDALQILFFSVLFGAALLRMGPKGAPITEFLDRLSTVMFGIVSIVVKAAPIGAFGAIAFTVGSFGLASLAPLLKLVLAMYATLAVFIVVVLGLVARMYGFSLYRLLAYLREELVLTISVMNSESAFPRLIDKLTSLGCSKGVVGLVMPTGYSMNQDGGMIYLSMAVGFIAQAYNIPLSIYDQLMLLILMMFTSKGVGGVQGAAFIILASTLAATGKLPVEGLALLLGVDRLLYIMRALGSVIGNSVATVVVAKMEGEFDESHALQTYRKVFEKPTLRHI